jgi:hypothetical protein
MSISAGPDLLFRLTQDFRPWLLSVAALGLVLGGAVVIRLRCPDRACLARETS